MKRLVCAALAVFLCGGLLSGCSLGGSTVGGQGDPPQSTAASTKAATTTQSMTTTTKVSAQTTTTGTTTQPPATTKKTTTTQKTTQKPTTQAPSPGSPEAIKIYVAQQDHGWELRLANKYNQIPKDAFPTALSTVHNGQFDARAAGALKQLIADAEQAGVSLWAQSLFRTYDYQKALFDKYVRQEMSYGYSKEVATQRASTYSAPPGGSDHNLGLGVDFSPIAASFENTAGYRWLSANAADYGFVLRYPKDKVAITTYGFEPWHWRYVGVDAAKQIKAKGWCLEEYIYFLEH